MAERNDPYRNFRFAVEIDGIEGARFQEVTIGDSTQEPIEYREGEDDETVRKLPGLKKYGNVTLKWGITDSMDLYSWRKDIEEGKIKENGGRRSISIMVLDELGEPKARWEFSAAWPSKYDPTDLNATGNEIAIETLEIVHEGMKRTA